MAHDGTGTGYDETAPADADLAKNEAKETRDLRKRVRIMNNKEHVAAGVASAGGEHLAGSAKTYYGGSAPTQRPDAATALGVSDAGRLWMDGAVLKIWSGSAWGAVGSGAGIAAATAYDLKTSGTDAGAFTSGSWQTRTLQTEQDPSGLITVSGNAVTMAAGTYYLKATAPAFKVGAHNVRLWNQTDGTEIAVGTPVFSGTGGDYAVTVSEVEAVIVLAASKAIRIEHRCATTNADNKARGRACAFGTNEIYARMLVMKLA